MSLTALQVKNSKATDKPIKLSDGRGLFLLINTNKTKYWRLAYRFDGKQKTLALGVYPTVDLAEARNRCDDARKLLFNGIDPAQNRKIQKAAKGEITANSFEVVGREWFAKFTPSWTEKHAEKIIRRLERDIFPWVGNKPIAQTTAQEILNTIRRIENRGALETAHRALQNCNQVFRYAVATGRADRNPCSDLRNALPPVKEKHHAAITNPKSIGELLRAIETYQGTFIVKCALRLAPLVFSRPIELRAALWTEFDLTTAEWNIPAERMKMRKPHLVPLSTQAVSILREIHALTGNEQYVFPSARSNSRPMCENAVLAALRRMGFSKEEMTGHGFRAMARTVLDEILGFRPDFIEHQLAHEVRDPNGRAYNRTAYLPQRREMMQAWSDYLDKLKNQQDF
jgi:integrase